MRSSTWSYFTKIDDKLALCKLCGKFIKTSGNTTNATFHLRKKHQKELIRIPEIEAKVAADNIESLPESSKDKHSAEEMQDSKENENDAEFEVKPFKKPQQQDTSSNDNDNFVLEQREGQVEGVTEFLVFQKTKKNPNKIPKIPKPRRKRSLIWNFFCKKEDTKFAQCRIGDCKMIVKCTTNTTNCLDHLKRRHNKIYQTAVNQPGQSTDDIHIEERDPIGESIEHPEDSEEVYMLEEDAICEDPPHLELKKTPKRPSDTKPYAYQQQKKFRTQELNDSFGSAPYDFSHPVDIFFASMAASVKNMTPEKIIAVKQKISNIIFEEELQQLRNEQVQYVYD